VADNLGTDVFLGATGIPPGFPLISGKSVVAYNLFRRCTTSEKLPAYKGNSFDVTQRAGGKLGRNSLPQIASDIIRVSVFEPRISTVFPTVTLEGEVLKISIRGALVTGETFTLVMDINNVTAAVVGVQVL
jgi:hypothetical protein